MQLTLIRHGITEWNVIGYFQGHSDVPLSKQGRKQAKKLRRRFAKEADAMVFDWVYSSPLQRAMETASIALPQYNIISDPRLMELNFGSFEGHSIEHNQQHPDWDWWFSDPYQHPAPHGESYAMLRERAVAWLESLPSEGNVLAFSHSGTIQMLLSHIMGVEHPRWRKRILLRHTSLTNIIIRKGEPIIERVNDAKHLKMLSEPSAHPFYD